MPLSRYHARHALLDGWTLADDVVIEVDDGGRISGVTVGGDVDGARQLPGLVIPGLANGHSHAFHRALRGRTHGGAGDFWRWRDRMYEVAARLKPDTYLELARGTYAEMALAGVTAVGEFHYLHRAPDGAPYASPNAMGEALVTAADDAGIRLTLLDACYVTGGFGEPLSGTQVRFGGDAGAWASRVRDAPRAPHVVNGVAIHSVRAVPRRDIATVVEVARDLDAPLHVHLSEQPAENAACRGATGLTPTQVLAEGAALGPRTTAVHATHLTDEDIQLLGSSRTRVCLCPTTERDLADGVGPAARLRDAGSPLCVGSDSHAVVDLLEEARAIELDERLATLQRGHHRPEDLLDAATAAGMSALGWEAGRIAVGQHADLVALDVASPRLAGVPLGAPAVVFAATAADVTHVVCSGRLVVDDRRHVRVDVASQLAASIAEVTS